ncbi:MAG TPA: DUF4271 domain-containing protein [Dysgonamonadaceae bacterium]|nr:DUF4271 domain-containing protein [Dysgonamonadaceae bacterium]HOT64151.1 DUF4271 domain-containing protein [Dysgonamonadaceae bacterium]HOV36668.1 DUF4271 domain-containing protein [Dysgonamonadaceae bacterium]HPD43517.1 DUF4271 domain-containing protein [Dysgonamonadaceae bacterium]HQG08517.1 DUF4271 domain-containing protein [Dysgonamonadaceae bacterium]
MFDTIRNTTLDATSFFLIGEPVVAKTDSVTFGFSPYKVIANDSTGIHFKKDSIAYSIKPVENGKTGIPRNYPLYENSLFFLIFLLCLSIFSFFYRISGESIRNRLEEEFRRKRHSLSYKEQVTTADVWGEFFMIVQTILIAAMVAYKFFGQREFVLSSVESKTIYFIGLGILFGFFILVRLLIFRLFGSVFFSSDVSGLMSKYLSLIGFMGILSFVPAFIFVFAPQFSQIMLIILIIIFFISRVIIIASVLDIFVKHRLGYLGFIVYLCGVEILPYFLLYFGAISLIHIVGSIASL